MTPEAKEEAKIIGARIRTLAEGYGSIKAFADALSVSPSNLQKYMRGDAKPGADMLSNMTRLGCNVGWVLTGIGDMMLEDEEKRLLTEPHFKYMPGNGGLAVPLPPDEDFIPQSARDVYEGMGEFYGGQPDWTQLPDDKQEPFLQAYQLMLAEIDDANEEYADGVREMAATRLRKIKASIRTYSARARDAFFGTGLPF